MKVLIINSSCGIGSTGRIVADLYKMLCEKGHNVKVAYGHGEPKLVPVEDTIRVNGKVGYYVHNVLGKLTDRAGFYSTKQTLALTEFIKEYNPDLIHLHNLHGFWINVEVLFSCLKTLGRPVVWTLHDCWVYTGHCAHYSFNGCRKWLTGCGNCKFLNAYPYSFFIDNSRKKFNKKKYIFTSVPKLHLITPSKWLANEVKRSFLKKYIVNAIPNGIDLEIFKPANVIDRNKFGIPDDKIMLLAVSFVWSKEKGLDDLLELNRRMDTNKYVLVMVGLDSHLKNSLPKNIVGIERTSNISELVELYSMADVLINPSYQETMGMVTVESIACGTPVIVYNKTAVPEFVDDDSGFVVEAGDINAIICSLDLATQLPKDRITACATKYEKHKQYEEYYKVYEKELDYE